MTNICFNAKNIIEMEIYSTRQAAEILGVSQKMITYLLRRNKLKGRKLGHEWMVLDLNYDRKPRGRPPRKAKE